MKNIVSCEIIKDLLPNYIENVLSKEGSKLVRDHIDSCIHCRKEYEVISSTLDLNTIDKMKTNYLKKINKRFLIMLALSLVVTVISIILLTFYNEPNLEEGILTLIFLGFIIIAIIIKFIIPLIGLIISIIYLRKTRKKILIVPVVICSIWLFNSLYIYIRNILYY